MNLADRSEATHTSSPGHAAMWPHWQPSNNLLLPKSTKVPPLPPGQGRGKGALATNLAISRSGSDQSSSPSRNRRVLYNFDGDSCLTTRAGSKGPVELSVEDVKQLIEEVAYDRSHVDAVLVCINAQVMYYPSKVGTFAARACFRAERANSQPVRNSD
jgi:hypothetical protein